MPIPEFLASLRARIGHDLLVLPSVSGCVFDGDGRLLMARHENGVWAPPGGLVEPDEDPAGALVREIREEVSLQVEPLGLIGVYGGPEFRVHYPNGDQASYVITVYGCAVAGGEIVPDGDEISEARFMTEAETEGLRLSRWAPVVLPDVFAWWRGRRG
ncbi:NUDIX domain-containing protein [Planomonospora venezuelensis]|uniref:ADP-ribose pyrophosphatase YjhB (NUDIX family) n=1 Tax=Planomonospora venezuelensis TaxID=1999 RepID=A0A841D5M6_PLAVE|nr:NUDIX domain-containing protein [Planomonospora venezuelensis]MBB5965952.1 ADP-ribose pyrophosphatase YjhB (NUDIX family) [Planomonospora venezuelensis]GIN01294.1 NUDIX hydrolase [Planomonospora venezuelensis]